MTKNECHEKYTHTHHHTLTTGNEFQLEIHLKQHLINESYSTESEYVYSVV